MKIKILYLTWCCLVCITFMTQCKSEPKQEDIVPIHKNEEIESHDITPNQLMDANTEEHSKPENNDPGLPDNTTDEKKTTSDFTELTEDEGIALEIRYATNNNFTKQKIYDCARCYLRPEAADNLLKAQSELQKKFGYTFKIFDCFRPRPYQQRLWDVVPDDKYVTPPAKGSMHSRGLAVDLTLVDVDGKELDMGTPYDFFGEEAHYGYNHPEAVKRNRWILKSTMEKYGFGGIRTEWWHFSYRKTSYPLDEWVWDCK